MKISHSFYVKETEIKTSWLTFMSVISCFGVVFLHVEECFFTFPVNDNLWILFLFLHCVLLFCVPCFFAMSGATLLNYRSRYDTKTYAWKRIKKALIPYLIWTFIALGYLLGRRIIAPDSITFSYIWNGIFRGNNINENFWFFPYLFSLYIIIPLLSLIEQEKKDFVYLMITIGGLIGIFLVPWIIRVTDSSQLSWLFGVDIFGPVVFACTGYFIKNYHFSKITNSIIWFISIISLVGMCVGTYFRSIHFGFTKYEYIDDCRVYYSNILIYLYSLGIMVLFKPVGNKIMLNGYLSSIFNFLSKFTFSIYLTHKMVRESLRDFLYQGLCKISTSSWIYLLTAPLLIIGLIVLLIWFLRKIPGLKRCIEYILP